MCGFKQESEKFSRHQLIVVSEHRNSSSRTELWSQPKCVVEDGQRLQDPVVISDRYQISIFQTCHIVLNFIHINHIRVRFYIASIAQVLFHLCQTSVAARHRRAALAPGPQRWAVLWPGQWDLCQRGLRWGPGALGSCHHVTVIL